MEYYLW